jgi:hypothetical protein
VHITIAVEGPTDRLALMKVCNIFGWEVLVTHGMRGKNHLDANLQGYNAASRRTPWIVLRDLDDDAFCAAELVTRLLPTREEMMLLRVAVRQIESWLMADAESFSTFFHVSQSRIPADPDSVVSAKDALLLLASRSRSSYIRRGVGPSERRRIGPDYTSVISDYINDHWRPAVAAQSSDSLARCLRRLTELADRA